MLIRADTRELVAVGDQSSGKSSLLEGLTGLSFPIASDLCTRFATQIVLRQTASEDIGAQITTIPGLTAQANDKLKAHLLTFQHNLREDQFGIDEFRDIFGKGSCHKIKLPTWSKLSRPHDTWAFLGQAAWTWKVWMSNFQMTLWKLSFWVHNTNTSVLLMSLDCFTVR